MLSQGVWERVRYPFNHQKTLTKRRNLQVCRFDPAWCEIMLFSGNSLLRNDHVAYYLAGVFLGSVHGRNDNRRVSAFG